MIKAGESRVLNLTAVANPDNSSYVLKRGGVIVNPGDISSFALTDGVLTISAISKEHFGQFSIIATNTEGTSMHNFSIDVQCKWSSGLVPASLELLKLNLWPIMCGLTM